MGFFAELINETLPEWDKLTDEKLRAHIPPVSVITPEEKRAWYAKHLDDDIKPEMDLLMASGVTLRYQEVELRPELVKAFVFSKNLHNSRNLKYGAYPYWVHYWRCLMVAVECDVTDTHVLEAILLHDTLEDCAITYSKLKENFGRKVADIVYDVTNELGKNRKERAERTYPKIAQNPDAITVKLCDRIANMEFSRQYKSPIFEKYNDEMPGFQAALYKLPKDLPLNELPPSPIRNLWARLINLTL